MPISSALLGGVKPIPENCVPPREFLHGSLIPVGLCMEFALWQWDSEWGPACCISTYKAVLQDSVDKESNDDFFFGGISAPQMVGYGIQSLDTSNEFIRNKCASENCGSPKDSKPNKLSTLSVERLGTIPTKKSCPRRRDIAPSSSQFCSNEQERHGVLAVYRFVTEACRQDKEPYPPNICEWFR